MRRIVWDRAGGSCEYCLLHESDIVIPHEPDHVIASQHGGVTIADNLALACFDCNRSKGPNIASTDPNGGTIVPLFNPRKDQWDQHFRLETDGTIVSLTAKGRATAKLLGFDAVRRVQLRAMLVRAGRL